MAGKAKLLSVWALPVSRGRGARVRGLGRSGPGQAASPRFAGRGPTYRRGMAEIGARLITMAMLSMVLAPGVAASTSSATRQRMAEPAFGLPPSGCGVAGNMLAQALAVAVGAIRGDGWPGS